MILADTGYFLALFVPGDGLYPRAKAWSLAVAEPLVVTEAVLFETLNAMAAPTTRQTAVTLLEQVFAGRGIRFVPVDAYLLQRGCDLYRRRNDKRFSLTDCVSFVVMNDYGMTTALSYDHHFEQAGFRALLREDPPAG